MLISHKGSDESLIKIFSKIPQDLTDKAENLLSFVGSISKKKIESRRLIFWSTKTIRASNGFNE